MTDSSTGIMVYSEDKEVLLQLLSRGRELSDMVQKPVFAVLLGEKIQVQPGELAEYGADKICIAENPRLSGLPAETCAEAIYTIASQVRPEILFLGGTKRGKEVAPRIAQMLGTGCASECVSVEFDQEKKDWKMKRTVFGGKVTSVHSITKRPVVATIQTGAYEKKCTPGRTAEIVDVKIDPGASRVEIIRTQPKEKTSTKIEEAPVLICGGRGLQKLEDFKLLEELADVLGGMVGCSRPVAADRGWFPDWIGLSGKKVHPSLYITVGVSGAIQHVAGIGGSGIVVSINKDPDAPIFQYSDYSIVGDLYKVIPALTEAIRRVLK